jgi:hypothetical protein
MVNGALPLFDDLAAYLPIAVHTTQQAFLLFKLVS